jgi:O-antigen ligase
MAQLPLALILAFALMSLAWLVPNHYPPWATFHSEITASFAFSILVATLLLGTRGRAGWPRLALLFLAAAMVPPLQASFGLIHFWGDAWVASLYLLATAMSLFAGYSLMKRYEPAAALSALWLFTLCAAIASVGIALYQWLGLAGLGLLAVDFPPTGRPFANLAQPNHLATLLMLGLVAAWGLFQRHLLGRPVLAAIILFLLFGVAMTQSRGAWLAIAGLVLCVFVLHDRASLRIRRVEALALGSAFAVLVAAWPFLCDALYLSPGRALGQQAEGGTRTIHWASMVDAIERQPWFGYGWNQVSVAQARVATEHPFTGEMIEHSHNILLDLLVWNGVPLGLGLIGGLAWWFWRHIRACRDATVALLLAGVGVVLIHAMLEFPQEYAYFLLPVGLMMGAVEALSPAERVVRVPRIMTTAFALVAAAMLVWLVVEYLQVEESHRRLRFDSARIGTQTVKSPERDIVLLTQLREFLRFARTEAQPSMSPSQLDWMRKVAERYGYPPVLFRYALAAGLNGRPQDAREALARLCKIHPRKRCEEGRETWTALRKQYPQLTEVEAPALPAER